MFSLSEVTLGAGCNVDWDHRMEEQEKNCYVPSLHSVFCILSVVRPQGVTVRVNENVIKQRVYINELEAGKIKSNNASLKQRMEIKKLKGQLRELQGDAEQLDNIDTFLGMQESVGMEQEAAIE